MVGKYKLSLQYRTENNIQTYEFPLIPTPLSPQGVGGCYAPQGYHTLHYAACYDFHMRV